jgi:hypothetical protein
MSILHMCIIINFIVGKLLYSHFLGRTKIFNFHIQSLLKDFSNDVPFQKLSENESASVEGLIKQ